MSKGLKKMDRLAEALLQPINDSAVIILGLFTVFWGLWVGNPFWKVFERADIYNALLVWAPNFIPAEIFWGVIAFTCGCITIWGVMRRSARSLQLGSGIMAWHWAMIGFFYFVGDWQATGGLTCICFCAYAIFIYLNIKVNHLRTGPGRH